MAHRSADPETPVYMSSTRKDPTTANRLIQKYCFGSLAFSLCLPKVVDALKLYGVELCGQSNL